jgi:hypothetical protein
VCHRDSIGVEAAGDLAETPAGGVFGGDAAHDAVRQRPLAADGIRP